VVEASDEVAREFGLVKTLSVNARTLGPRIGKDVQQVIQQAKAGNWKLVDGEVVVGEFTLKEGEYELTLTASASESSGVGLTSTGFVLLNQAVTEELEREGAARDAVRHIQQARKDADLNVSDRISLSLIADEVSVVALQEHSDFIARETLATKLSIEAGAVESGLSIGDSGQLQIALSKR